MMPADWLLHLQHAYRHMETAWALIGQGDREEAYKHIAEAHVDLAWAKRQLRAHLGLEQTE